LAAVVVRHRVVPSDPIRSAPIRSAAATLSAPPGGCPAADRRRRV